LASALTLSVPASALGLGKLTVLSGLGQPLSAQIELTAAQKDELDSLRARIADISVYRDNSVQFPGVLSRARVTLEQGANNTPYLRVTTVQPVNEPFLDMIIEISWATGRVIRDYTFLLDPPGSGETQAVEPTRPIVAQATPPSERRGSRRGAPAAAAEGAATGGASTGGAAGGDTYTVRRGDTLSKIAKDYKPDNVTLEQMLLALFRNNESAFDGKNMNRLRTGQILNVPPADQVGSVTQSEAVQVVKVQAADWRAYRDRVAAAAQPTEATSSRQSAGGKIGTVEDQAAPTQPGKDQLRVSRESGKGTGAGVAEDVAAKDKALREANARVAELEKTVKDLQKAAELRNQTLAELQSRAEAAKGKAPEAPPKVAVAPAPISQLPQAATSAAPPPAAPAVTAAPAPAPEAKAPETKALETKPPETKAAETKASEVKVAETKAAAPAPEAKAEPKAPETKAEPPAPAPKAEPAPPPVAARVAPKKAEPSFLDDLFGNTPTWAIGGGALVVLAGIAGIIAARRRKTTKFEDSIISGTDIKTNTVFGSTGGGVVNTGDNSLASDFSREGLGSIDTDEVDPIAEAEVYLAYGRDAQAEEILKDALKKDSQRQEIYLKLLEIHAQHNKPSAFETVASELYSVSGGQGEVWQKAMALGRQLDPSNPLFAEAGGAAAPASATEAPVAEAGASSDTQVFSVPPELKPEPHTASALDFSLDEDISLAPTSGAAEPKTPAAILAGAEQEVAKSSRGAGEGIKGAVLGGAAAAVAGAAAFAKVPEKPVQDTVSFEPESVPKFDLDFQLEEPSMPLPLVKSAPAPKAPEPEPAMAVASAPAPQLARPAAAIELDKLDLAFDPQRSTFEDPTPSVLDGQWHDAATKLDLAKAYQEMGDVEGAREILQEVLHEGDDQQKAEAQTLLAKLA
jgi:pilus assembly protein FimV